MLRDKQDEIRLTKIVAQYLDDSPAHIGVIDAISDELHHWTHRVSQRTTRSEAQLKETRNANRPRGLVLGVYDRNDGPLELTMACRGRVTRDHRESAANEAQKDG
jgi:hypothetical protein